MTKIEQHAWVEPNTSPLSEDFLQIPSFSSYFDYPTHAEAFIHQYLHLIEANVPFYTETQALYLLQITQSVIEQRRIPDINFLDLKNHLDTKISPQNFRNLANSFKKLMIKALKEHFSQYRDPLLSSTELEKMLQTFTEIVEEANMIESPSSEGPNILKQLRKTYQKRLCN